MQHPKKLVILSHYLNVGEDELFCDLAETYGVLDMERLPLSRVAALAAGLRDNSRIKQKIAGTPHPVNVLLHAAILDGVNMLVWLQSKDAQSGENRPKSVLHSLLGADDSAHETFDDGAAFMARWTELTRDRG